ncbi:MAG TPA: tetratricopeptide repeat protein [Blastocatellia bacterium]|nr:tetratricopeptide repeat protein [Blastocatellia bacterium]
MEKYYRELAQAGDEQAIAEAIYHANQLDWKGGVNEWIHVFDAALKMSRYKLCGALLDVRGEMSIESDFYLGWVSQNEGDYFLSLARYENARREYLESITAYNKVLALTPDDPAAHNNRGNALQSLGDLQAKLSQHNDAMQSYNAAILACSKALALAPDYVAAHRNKGNALKILGDLQAQLSQHDEAVKSWQVALAEASRVLEIAPNDKYAKALMHEIQSRLAE